MSAPTIQKPPTKQKVESPPPKAPRYKARKVSTWRRWLRPTLVAIGVLAALVAIGMLVGTLTTPDTGSVVQKDTAVIHDDAWNVQSEPTPAIIHDDAGNVQPEGTPAVIHDDAGNMAPPESGSAIIHDDAGNVVPKAEVPWVNLHDTAGNAHQVHVRTGAEDVWVTLYDAEGDAHQVHAH